MIIIDSHKKMLEFWDHMRAEFNEKRYLKVTLSSGSTRTAAQNRALHLWCDQLASELNARGLDFRVFFKEGYEIPFDQHMVKEHIWKPIQRIVTGHDSTTKPTPEQYKEIFEIIAKNLAEKHGIVTDWPCKEGV